MRLIFIPVEWMHYYVGDIHEERELPACAYNFQYVNSKYYGYAEGLEEIPLEKLDDVSKEADKAEDVTVVWVAKQEEGEHTIVGWYKKATLYRTPQKKLTLDNERVELVYSIEGDVRSCTLLPIEERGFILPKAKETIWFEEDKTYRSDIAAYLHNYAGVKINSYVGKENLEKEASITFDDYEKYLIKADEFQNKGLYDKAIRWCNKAIHEVPDISIAYECKANILLSLKMYDEALELYKKLIEMEPSCETYTYCLGLCYGLKENYKKALTYYNTYLQSEEDASSIADRGVINYNLGYYDEAKRDFERATKLEGDNPFFEKLQSYYEQNNSKQRIK